MTSKIRRGSWLVTVPLAAIAILYFVFFFLPGSRRINRLNDQIERKQDYIGQTDGLAAALRDSQEALEETRTYNARWLAQAPRRRELSALYGKINALVKAAGATTTRFDPEPVVADETVSRIPLKVGCEGAFGQIYEFIRSLETLPLEIWVDDVHLEKVTDSKGTVRCELALVVFADNPDNSDYVDHPE